MKPTLFTIKDELTEMLHHFDKDQRCIYVDYPLHTNVGDLLINTGCEQFFLEQKVNIWRRYNYYDFPKRIPGITNKDVLLLHGGGNFGDLWFNFQSFRERIMDQYPNNRIVFLPQTVHFSSEEKAVAAIQRMNRHGNFHVFARDHRSLEQLKRLGLRSVSPMPDTAHALAGTLRPDTTTAPSGVLRLVRQDVESSDMPSHLAPIQGDTRDWDQNFFGRGRRIAHYGVVNFVKGIGRYGPPIDCHPLWYWHRDNLIQDGINTFSSYDAVFTNRLHGMILALLLDRQVIAFDNNYGKLSTYYDSWLSGIDGLDFHKPRVNNAAIA
ncbi:polysaccharide pyruvyl transferase family protein [Acidobacterium sp. S8]|uniref:polysaccharide pyruvyl transferase family protein n=1 Tax=Acidobacterium sp. S8 TaxID=1641854 RepID=UPI00131DEF1D|nr:polysaccharide pyruvyl transferase family protein [Acidobacterium sp. S8]